MRASGGLDDEAEVIGSHLDQTEFMHWQYIYTNTAVPDSDS